MNEEKWLRAQTLSNVVIAVFTVVLTVVGYYQWRVTQIALNRTGPQNDFSLCPMDYYGFERELEKCES